MDANAQITQILSQDYLQVKTCHDGPNQDSIVQHGRNSFESSEDVVGTAEHLLLRADGTSGGHARTSADNVGARNNVLGDLRMNVDRDTRITGLVGTRELDGGWGRITSTSNCQLV